MTFHVTLKESCLTFNLSSIFTFHHTLDRLINIISMAGLAYSHYTNSLLGKNEEVRGEYWGSETNSGKYGQTMNTQNQAKHQIIVTWSLSK